LLSKHKRKFQSFQKTLEQIKQIAGQDSEMVKSFLEVLSILLETEDLSSEERTAVQNEIQSLIVQGYAKGSNFENVRSAINIGSAFGFHSAPVNEPRTPGGMGFPTGGTDIVFSSSAEARRYVNFLMSIGVPGGSAGGEGQKSFNSRGRSGDGYFLYPPFWGSDPEETIRIWNG